MNADEVKPRLSNGDLVAARYCVEALIGRGGMGEVHRARDRKLDEIVALKLLCAGPTSLPMMEARFREEVRLARRVTHPNVARVYDLGEHEGDLFLTMEYIEGDTLRARLRSGEPITTARALSIARALAEGLAAVHAAGVVHRDLKPSNAMLGPAGRVVLVDFGVARRVAGALDLTLGVVGTPGYMAPEQTAGREIDGRADVYALGLVLAEMLTGVHVQASVSAVVDSLAGGLFSGRLRSLTQACLALDPAARPDAAELARQLTEIEIDWESPTTVPVAGPTSPSREREGFSGSELLPAGRVLAVLAFRGSELGEPIADELVDVLARTRGLRVLGTGATARFRDDRDPRALGRALGAVAVVDGTVQRQGERIRVVARLFDASTGLQLWSDHHEGRLDDLFAFQEAFAQRIAEELRVEMTTLEHRQVASPEVVDMYLKARRDLRRNDLGAVQRAMATFQRCLEAAPEFRPATALFAMAGVRAWFLSVGASHPGSLSPEELRCAVARALAAAPDLAESHLAAAMLAVQKGALHEAVRHLLDTLRIAPTCADAHEYLGVLQCEAGRAEEGVRRLKLAAVLAPELHFSRLFLARERAFEGDYPGAEALLDELDRQQGGPDQSSRAMRIRFAIWRGDRIIIEKLASDLPPLSAPRVFAESIIETNAERCAQRLDELVARANNPRFRSLMHQLAVEVHASRGEIAPAERHLELAAAAILVDIAWLDRCPPLSLLRDGAAFASVRHTVAARASAFWIAQK